MQAHLCCVVCLLRSRAVLCLSHSRAVSERSDSLCCWCASLLLSLSYCHFSSLTCLLYLWTRSLAWRCHLFSKSSIVSWALAHQDGHMPEGTYTICKLVYFSRKPVTDIHTYIHTYKHNLRLRPHKRLLRLHNYVPHAKAFGSNEHHGLKSLFHW